MKLNKEKLIILVLTTVFASTAGMFYYNNYYMKVVNKTNVYVATQNIPSGTPFTNENIGAVQVDKGSVLPGAITDISKIKDQRSNTAILKDEPISLAKIEDKSSTADPFLLTVTPSIPCNFKQGDVVRVYVNIIKTDTGVVVGELYSKKTIKSVAIKKDMQTKADLVQNFDIETTDEENYNYLSLLGIAKLSGYQIQIMPVKYEDISKELDSTAIKFGPSLDEKLKEIELTLNHFK